MLLSMLPSILLWFLHGGAMGKREMVDVADQGAAGEHTLNVVSAIGKQWWI